MYDVANYFFLLHTLPSIVPHDFVSEMYRNDVAKARIPTLIRQTTLFLRLLQSSENQLGQCLFNNLFGKESSAPCADQYYYQYFYYDYYTCARYRLLPTAAVLLLPSNHYGSRSGSRRRAKSTFSLLCSLSLEYLARKCHRDSLSQIHKCGNVILCSSQFIYRRWSMPQAVCIRRILTMQKIDLADLYIGKAVMDKTVKQIFVSSHTEYNPF